MDLLSTMSAYSADNLKEKDGLDALPEGSLDPISRLANEASDIEREIEATEKALKEYKKQHLEIIEQKLPDALEAVGLKEFTLLDGAKIEVKPFYAASISAANREAAFTYLRDHGYGDLIKNQVTVSCGAGEDQAAEQFVAQCEENRLTPAQATKGEPMPLKAWFKERIEVGDPVPLQIFGGYISQRAKIKRSK